MIQPRDDLRSLEGYHSPQLDVQVRLNTNESPFPPPAAFVEAWTEELARAAYHRYPSRAAGTLRAAIGARLGHDADRVFAANGSNEVLQTILLTYGGPGRRSLVFEPTYALHAHISRITATEVCERRRAEGFALDAAAAVDAVRQLRPSVTFVCTPNNPTGTVEARSTVEALADAVAAVGGLLVVDEAYGEFADWSAMDLLDDDRPLVVVRTYSKVWSLAGIRLGYALGPAAVVAELDKVVLPYHLSIPTQLAGEIALRFEDEMRSRVARLVEERARVFAALEALAGVTPFPSGANFVLLRVEGGRGHALWRALVDRGVLVRDFSAWPGVEDCLRVTIGTPAENDAFLAATRDALETMGANA